MPQRRPASLVDLLAHDSNRLRPSPSQRASGSPAAPKKHGRAGPPAGISSPASAASSKPDAHDRETRSCSRTPSAARVGASWGGDDRTP